jgi:hypothetical protein
MQNPLTLDEVVTLVDSVPEGNWKQEPVYKLAKLYALIDPKTKVVLSQNTRRGFFSTSEVYSIDVLACERGIFLSTTTVVVASFSGREAERAYLPIAEKMRIADTTEQARAAKQREEERIEKKDAAIRALRAGSQTPYNSGKQA